MTASSDTPPLDEEFLDENALAEEIQRRERLMLRWPLLVGTSAVLYGSLMVIYIIFRVLAFLHIYVLSAELPPTGLLLAAQFFPILSGFFLGGLLFMGGIITLRRRLLGPRLINLWAFFMLAAIVVTLLLRLETLPDFVDRQMEVYERTQARELVQAPGAEESIEEAEPARPEPSPELAAEQLAGEASRFFVAFAIMGVCGPGLFALILNLPRIRRTWLCSN